MIRCSDNDEHGDTGQDHVCPSGVGAAIRHQRSHTTLTFEQVALAMVSSKEMHTATETTRCLRHSS